MSGFLLKKCPENAILETTIFDKPDIIRVFWIKKELFKIQPVFESQVPIHVFLLGKAIQFLLRSNFIRSTRNKPDYETLHSHNHNRFLGKLKNVLKQNRIVYPLHLHKKWDRFLSTLMANQWTADPNQE